MGGRRVRMLAVPWDSGHRGMRMGAGPVALLDAGLADVLRGDGHDVDVAYVDGGPPRDGFRTEVATGFDLCRALSRAVSAALADGARPLVLSGGCISANGTVAGLGPGDVGVVWLDAHADLNTPDTTASGFLDGTAAATLLGRCWTTLASSIPGFAAVPAERLALVGVRDLDDAEVAWLEHSPVARVRVADVRERGAEGTLGPALESLAGAGARRAYVHVDIDVLDPSVARVNGYQAAGGLDVDEVVGVIAAVGRRLGVAAGALTALDPAADDAGRGVAAAVEVVRALASAN